MTEKKSGYAYTNTRVRVMKSRLFKAEDFQRMLRMSIQEIARLLGETEYKREIDEMGTQFSGVNLIEYGVNRNMAHSFKKILDFAIRESRDDIKLWLKKWDVWNIKMLLRGNKAKAPNEEIFPGIIPAGEFDEQFWRDAIQKTNTVEEAIEYLNKTEYHPILQTYTGELSEVEDRLDEYYYKQLLEGTKDEIREFVQEKIIGLNELNKARAKKAEIQFKSLDAGTIEGKKKFRKNGEREINLKEERLSLRKKWVEKGRKMVHEFKLTVIPVIGYFVAKENETDNIRIIVRGKHSGLPLELIEKQLVI